jgi:glycosyltransferase involved in cell wall biosynthesis
MSESSLATTTVPVSVVIPCYRHTDVLARSITSVANQSSRPLELIVVNDGCGDELGKVLLGFQEHFGSDWFSVVTLPDNVGAGEARNAGWAVARGEYIAFLDADDAWHPRKLEIQYNFMKAHPNVAVSGHRHRQESDQIRWDDYELTGRYFEIKLPRLLFANQFTTPSAMVKRDLAVRFAVNQRHMEDFRLWLTVVRRGGRMVKLDAELACTFKAIFGASGLSAEMVSMEIGELQTYWAICKETPLMLPMMMIFAPYSLAKFMRRYWLLWIRSFNVSRSASR